MVLETDEGMGKEYLNLCSQVGTTELQEVGVRVSCGLALCASVSHSSPSAEGPTLASEPQVAQLCFQEALVGGPLS